MPSKILTGSILFLVSISATAQDFLIGNEEIEKNGMPMVARSISGSMAGMNGTVTINLVKLSNGSYLYETTNQNDEAIELDRKSTRLNSSHLVISYAVFCLKKKKTQHN